MPSPRTVAFLTTGLSALILAGCTSAGSDESSGVAATPVSTAVSSGGATSTTTAGASTSSPTTGSAGDPSDPSDPSDPGESDAKAICDPLKVISDYDK